MLTLPTLLDPRFKQIAFVSASKAQEAVVRLKNECVQVMRSSSSTPSAPVQPAPLDLSGNSNDLWSLLDHSISQSRHTSSFVADAIIEVDRYMAEVHLPRGEDPLMYWTSCKRQCGASGQARSILCLEKDQELLFGLTEFELKHSAL
ncbi:hypothetical protein WMY93_011192 [Mugilogobius chulae]|uniref:Uncharacterized protein n=1 Tax=Mugilogobius chulae TaxID=88201 RepID=A0AAW0P552_9GOBI